MSFFPRMLVMFLTLSLLASGAAALSMPRPVSLLPPAAAEYNEDMDLTELSLEELMDMEVTIVSRSATSIADLPAAVYVLTGDEIRRSGFQSVQEALRMVPGFYVSHWTGNDWDVTARGFGTGLALTNQAYLNELLVMIDGVVVYTPLFAGVWWALQDIPLADVDRIEVVKGPAGILWGSHATHGVVNVITKSGADTQGLRVSARAGTQDRNLGLRYGGTMGESGTYRAWVRTKQYDNPAYPFLDFDYAWQISSGGARFEWQGNGKQYTVWTRAYVEENGNDGFDLTDFVPIQAYDDKSGVQLSATMEDPEVRSRWSAWFSTDKQDMPTLLDQDIYNFDLDYQRRFQLGDDHDLMVGGGYRMTYSELNGADPFWEAFDPVNSTQNTFRAYAIDTWTIVEDVTSLTAGLAVEDNAFVGLVAQPTVRGTWWAREDWMVWGGLTSSVRTPSLEERHLTETSAFAGNDEFQAEKLLAYELGTRALPASWLTIDMALFYNFYDDLHLAVFNPDIGNDQIQNDAEGQTWGGELALDFDLTSRWRMRSGYAYLNGVFNQKSTGLSLPNEGKSPKNTFNLRSYYNLGNHWELDGGMYVVDGMGPDVQLAEYVRLDVRLGWNPSDQLKLSLGVQDLNQNTHSELDQYDNVLRNVYASLEWTP